MKLRVILLFDLNSNVTYLLNNKTGIESRPIIFQALTRHPNEMISAPIDLTSNTVDRAIQLAGK